MSWRRMFPIVVLVGLLPLSLSDSHADDEDPIVVSISTGLQPFMGEDINGEPSGMLVDLWTTWAERVDRDITFQMHDWPGSIAAIQSGSADIHAGMFESQVRSSWLQFSSPLYEVSSSVYVRSDSQITDLSQLGPSARIGVLAGSAHEERFARQYPNLSLVSLDTPADVAKSLLDGSVDAVTSEDGSFQHLASVYGARGTINRLETDRWVDDVHAGVLESRPDLIDLIERGLRELDAQDYQDIERRWLDPDIQVDFRVKGRPFRLTPEEEAWLNSQASITVGVMDQWTPFSFQSESDQRIGISVSVFHHINELLGDRLTLKPGAWAQVLEDVKNGETDAVLDITPNVRREPHYLFTTHYLETSHAVFSRPSGSIEFAEPDFNTATIALERGFGNIRYLRDRYPDITILEADDTLAALQMVANGEAEHYVGNRIVGLFTTQVGGISDRVVPEAQLDRAPTRLNIGVRRDARILRDILQKAIDTITPEMMDGIISSWVGAQSSSGFTLTDEERAWLSTHRRVGMFVGAWPPFHYLEDGEPRGLAYEYTNRILTDLGLEVDIRHMTWPEARESARNFQGVDVLPAVAYTQERAEFLNFSQEYISIPLVIFTRVDADVVTSIEDLVGQVVAVERDFITHHRLASDYPNLQLQFYPTTLEALEAVSLGRADAYLGNLAAGSYLIESEGLGNLKVAAPSGYDESTWRIAVRKDWPELASLISKYLSGMSDEMHAELRRSALSVRFEHGIDWWTVIIWAGGVAFVMGSIILVVVYWNQRLGHEVRQRKMAEEGLSDALNVVSDSINYASEIQHSILPDMSPLDAVLEDYFVLWEPRDIVGGDIYWCRYWGDGVLIVLGDCTGHGVPGAFVTLLANGALDRSIASTFGGDLQGLINKFHRTLQKTLGQRKSDSKTNDGLDLGACYIAPDMRRVFFVGAKFDLFVIDGDEVTTHRGDKKGVGYRDIAPGHFYDVHEVPLKEGCSFYMTTDGIIDQVGGARRRAFGKKRFRELISSVQNRPLSEQGKLFLEAIKSFQGGERRRDDIAAIGFKVRKNLRTSRS